MAAAGLFVGRDGALAELEQAWAAVVRGHPRLVLVSGDAGIGKSTLVARFLDGRTDALVLRGGCFGLVSAELPYAPVVQALRPLADSPDAAPLCAALTGADQGAGEASRWAQSRLFETTLRLLGALSRERPVVLALEDVHWADRATLDLLVFLLGNVVSERVLVLLTTRCDEPDDPDWLTDALQRLTSGPAAEVLELPPLDGPDTARLAHALGVADGDAERLAERAGGNPLFLTELARSRAAGGVPRRLRDLLLLRLRHVSPAARRVVEVLSAATTPLSARLLVRALGDDVVDPRAAVAEAFDAHLLAPGGDLLRPGHALLGEAVYAGLPPTERAWLHERLAEAVEAEPGLGDAAWALAAYHWDRAGRPDRLPVPLARSAQAAGRCYAFADATRAWQRLLELDDRSPGAIAAGGLDRASVLVELATASRSGPEPAVGVEALVEARRLVAGDDVRAALVCEQQARLELDLGRIDDALASAGCAIELARAAAAPVRARVETSLAAVLMLLGDYQRSREHCRTALSLLPAGEQSWARTHALTLLAVDLVNLGDADGALAAMADAAGAGASGEDPETVLRRFANHVYVLEAVGDYAGAVRTAQEGLRFAARQHLSVVAGTPLLVNEASARIAMGDHAAARATLAEALGRPGRASSRVYAGLRLAETDVELGDVAAAEERLAAAAGVVDGPDAESVVATQFRLVRALIALVRGRPDQAVAQALDELDRSGGRTEPVAGLRLIAVGLRALTRMAATPDVDVTAVAADLVAAAGVLREQAPLPPSQALHDLCRNEHRELLGGAAPEPWRELAARLQARGPDGLTPYVLYREAAARLATQGRAAAAEPLRAAWRLLPAAEGLPLRRDVAALAATCRVDLDGARSRPADPTAPGPSRFGLTPREAEVLDLVCEGATNRSIARTLGMSERTAAVHVSHILTKLSARNRAEAIATAHRTGAVRVPSS